MKKILNWALVLPLIASIGLAGCQKDNDEEVIQPPVINNPVEDKILVASGTSDEANLDIRVYADQDLFVGYNKLYTLLFEKGTMNQVKSGKVEYHPLMKMTAMSHSCPTENPEFTDPVDGLFEGAAIFIMPSGNMGSWTLGVTAHNNANGLEGTVDLDITVVSPTDARVFSFESPVDQKKIFITMVEPSGPEVGMNDFIVTAHVKESMMSFPALEDLNIEFEPMMPSMGHGSPNNENPVHILDGHYQGIVNFTMSGWWELNMTINDDMDAILDDTHSFDVNF